VNGISVIGHGLNTGYPSANAGGFSLCNIHSLMDFDYIDTLRARLAYAEEQLMIADTMPQQRYWGDMCDHLEAFIEDAHTPVGA